MSLRTPPPVGTGQTWMRRVALLGVGLLALACASEGPREANLEPLALATRAKPGVIAVKTWSAECAPEFEGELGLAVLLRFAAKHPGKFQVRRDGGTELEFETDLAGFEALAAETFEFICTLGPPQPAPSPLDLPELDPTGWRRREALAIRQQPARRVSLAVLAPAADQEQVARVLRAAQAELDARHRPDTPDAHPGTPTTEGLLIESSASQPSEVRWVVPADLHRAHPRERALWCLRAARLAMELPGWSFVPASIDLLGNFEPAYLYTSADVPAARERLRALRSALDASWRQPLDPATARREFRLRDERLRFARAQLGSELFQLRALHYQYLEGFEAVADELQALTLADLIELDPSRGFCSVVGPSAAWGEELGHYMLVRQRASAPGSLDVAVEAELERMWSALGGVQPWRELAALRLQSQLDVEGAERSQGIEQWIDFAGDRFVLAQALGTLETIVVVTAAQAWAIGEKETPELAPEQARRLRTRQERTLFALLRRLAQPARGGLQLRREAERLIVSDAGIAMGWIELGADGLPRRSGYALEGETQESLYQYEDWVLDAPLPHPARTLQLDRKAVSTLRTIEAGAAPDPQIWERR